MQDKTKVKWKQQQGQECIWYIDLVHHVVHCEKAIKAQNAPFNFALILTSPSMLEPLYFKTIILTNINENIHASFSHQFICKVFKHDGTWNPYNGINTIMKSNWEIILWRKTKTKQNSNMQRWKTSKASSLENFKT